MGLSTPDGGFSRYGVTLSPITEGELELVRGWRNDPKIASQMIDQTFITAEMQRAWFARLTASERDLTCVARFRGEPIGVGSLARFDSAAGTCEPGLYVFDDRYRGNLVPFCLGLAINDLAFEHLGARRLVARVVAENAAALRFNAALGYATVRQDDDGLVHIELEYAPYVAARDRITRFIRWNP
jgi:UDP-4-amino-4,6-dideoxy-N-acetyl-beta-L-altrosamine N-acetyltransferase